MSIAHWMSACGIWYVAFVYTARRRVDSGRHRHNLIIVLQHSPVSWQQHPSPDVSCQSWEWRARRHLTNCWLYSLHKMSMQSQLNVDKWCLQWTSSWHCSSKHAATRPPPSPNVDELRGKISTLAINCSCRPTWLVHTRWGWLNDEDHK